MDTAKPDHNRSGSGSGPILAAVAGLGVLSAAVYLFNFKLSKLVPILSKQTDIHFHVGLVLFTGVIYLLAAFLILKNASKIGNSKSMLTVIVFFAVIFRFSLIPIDPDVLSKDIYRYIWDGRVQQNHINPYRYPPAAPELKPLREARIFPNINRKEYPTLYPAGAQLFFRLCYVAIGNSVYGYKGILVFFDILTILGLAALLRAHGFATARLIVYAWNPLVIFEIAYSGHLEGITVFLIVTALYLNQIAKKAPAVILLAAAGALKLYPALLLAAFLNRRDAIKGILTFGLVCALFYLPYATAGMKVSGFLPVYLSDPKESFNLGLKYLLMRIFPGLDYYLLSKLFIFALLAAGLLVFWKEKQGLQVIRCAYILTGLLMILMPASLHPWYVVMLVPFLAFFPSLAWLIFTITVTLSYLQYVAPQGIMPVWVLLCEYLTLFAMLAAGLTFKKSIYKSWTAASLFTRKDQNLVEVPK